MFKHVHKDIPFYLTIIIIVIYQILLFQFEYAFSDKDLFLLNSTSFDINKNELPSTFLPYSTTSPIEISSVRLYPNILNFSDLQSKEDNSIDSINKKNNFSNPINNYHYNFGGMLEGFENDANRNTVSNNELMIKELEKLIIQYDPEIDNIIADSDPKTFLLRVLQQENGEGVTLCHMPNTPAEQTLVVDPSAVAAHFDHGDYPGPCQIQEEIVVDTIIDSAIDGNGVTVQPGGSTSSNDITFGYSGTVTPDDINVLDLGFECRLDQEIFTSCNDSLFDFTASKQYTNLSEGEHNFTVIAFIDISVGEFGVERIYDESPEKFTWTIIPELDTKIESAEDGNGILIANETISISDSMTFTFSAVNNITEAGFLCSLDGSEAEVCSSGSITYEDLEIGEHIFRVSAFIPDGEFDTSPATFTWTIIELDTILESAEDGDGEELESGDSTTSDSITFEFSAELNGEPITEINFQCTLDGILVQDCSSGSITYTDLSLGDHNFQVFAFIPDVIADPEPETFTWTIEEEPPEEPEEEEPPEEPEEEEPPEEQEEEQEEEEPPEEQEEEQEEEEPPEEQEEDQEEEQEEEQDENNNPPNNNNPPSAGNNPQIPNEAAGEPSTDTTPPFGNGPTGGAPFSPITPAAIDPSVPRDITIYQEQYQNPGPINAKYGTQVRNQCLLELDNNKTIVPENITQVIFQETGQSVQLLDLMNIGNTSIAKINNCNTNVLGNLANTTIAIDRQLDLYGEIASANTSNNNNSTFNNNVNSDNTTVKIIQENSLPEDNANLTNKSTISSNPINDTARPSNHLSDLNVNITWDPNLPNSFRSLTNDTIQKLIQNMSDQKINSTITKNTLFNVTFYQFTPLDIARILLDTTNTTLIELNKTSISPIVNETTSVPTSIQSNKTGLLAPPPSSITEPIDIAIVDTGVSLSHPDLSIYGSLSFVNGNVSVDPATTEDRNGHGSHVAGIISAKDNGYGIVGIAPMDNIRIWSMKVCSDDGVCAISDQINAIEYITKHSDMFDVVNYSIENPYSKLFEKAISESVKAGIAYIVAAGNFAKNATLTTSPASNPDVITVSAIGDSDGKCGGLGPLLDNGRISDDTFANFSNFGPSIDIAAPGVDIISTFNGTDYGILTGTSMAVPHVTGLAALLKIQNPNASPEDLKEMIIKSGSTSNSECLENKGIGYFSGDVDDIAEPLIVLPKKIISNHTQSIENEPPKIKDQNDKTQLATPLSNEGTISETFAKTNSLVFANNNEENLTNKIINLTNKNVTNLLILNEIN